MDWTQTGVEKATFLSGDTTNITTGSSVTYPLPGTTGLVFDVRQYSSYYLQVVCTTNTGPTDLNPIAVRLNWFEDTGGLSQVYTDDYVIFSAQAVVGINRICFGGQLIAQDTMHGPFMRYNFQNTLGGPDTVTVSHTLTATTRQLPGPYMREISASGSGAETTGTDTQDNYILPPSQGDFTLGIGGQINVPFLMRYGRYKWRMNAPGAGTASIYVAGMSNGLYHLDTLTAAGAAIVQGEGILPKRAGFIQLTNQSGAANQRFIVQMVTLGDKF